MLSIITYESTRNLHSLDFLKDSKELETCIVCPNPTIADAFRDKLELSNDDQDRTAVFTIAKYVSDLVKNFSNEMKTTRKSELMVILAGVWKSKFQELPPELFHQSFNIFTDLRSFTLDFNLMEEVLSKLDPEISKVVELFWHIVESPVLELLDEHGSYHLLAEKIKESGAEESSKNLIFYGFSHLSGSQVDLLKALSVNNDVFIPINGKALEHAIDFDWPKWLDNDFKIEQREEEEIVEKKYSSFLKNRLGESILSWEKLQDPELDIFIAEKTPSFNQIVEIPVDGLFFKTSTNFLRPIIKEIFIDLKKSVDSEIPTEQLQEKLQKLFENELKKDDKEKDFRKLKVIRLLSLEIAKMLELTDSFSSFGLFELSILEEVVTLNAPRVSSIPLFKEQKRGEVKGLAALETFNNKVENALVISGSYSPLKGKEDFYSEEIMEILSSIGPVKRPEFEFQLTKAALCEVIQSEKTHLFIEKGLLEHDLNWATVLSQFKLSEKKGKELSTENKVIDVPAKLIGEHPFDVGKMSASRVQTYLDCPRKFYFSYLDKLDHRIVSNEIILPMDLGSLQHKVIEDYMNNNTGWDYEIHVKEVWNVLNEFVEKNKLNITELDLESYFVEIKNNSGNGIKVLLEFKEVDPTCRFIFEQKLEDENVSGSIDCIVESKFGKMILDFKRSSGSIPSAKMIVDFKKIQLWFYSRYCNLPVEEIAMIGYINLSNISTSMFMIFHAELSPIISGMNHFKKLKPKPNVPKFGLSEKLDEFEKFHLDKWEEVKNDKTFQIKPSSSNVCGFCPVKTICPRVEVQS
ncbi:MAG: PD-(D/E)XK nuclease family protein [Bacteriovoracaceae bacterium]|nr:PD-(D/E)XK nuclease family protein [Bacteriovoracaceae bacterium]